MAQYTQIADHLYTEGFFPKAAALYKKILKIKPDQESVQLHLAEISAKQGLLADAKATSSPSPTSGGRGVTVPAPTNRRPPRIARPLGLRRARAAAHPARSQRRQIAAAMLYRRCTRTCREGARC